MKLLTSLITGTTLLALTFVANAAPTPAAPAPKMAAAPKMATKMAPKKKMAKKKTGKKMVAKKKMTTKMTPKVTATPAK